MPTSVRSRLVEHLLETLSLVEHFEEQNPHSPVAHAALCSSLQDLISELKTISAENAPEDPTNNNHC